MGTLLSSLLNCKYFSSASGPAALYKKTASFAFFSLLLSELRQFLSFTDRKL